MDAKDDWKRHLMQIANMLMLDLSEVLFDLHLWIETIPPCTCTVMYVNGPLKSGHTNRLADEKGAIAFWNWCNRFAITASLSFCSK